MNGRWPILVVTALLAAPMAARGQTPLFFSSGMGAFEPEIGVVDSGVVMDVQAGLSPDPRYVTLNMNAAQSQLLSLSTFAFEQSTGIGFVGNVRFSAGQAGDSVHVVGSVNFGSASGSLILNQRGMTRIVGR